MPESTTPVMPTKHYRDGSLGFTERDFALYDSIIVKKKGTIQSTVSIDRMDLDDRVRTTWAEHGLPPVPKQFKALEEPWEPKGDKSKKEQN